MKRRRKTKIVIDSEDEEHENNFDSKVNAKRRCTSNLSSPYNENDSPNLEEQEINIRQSNNYDNNNEDVSRKFLSETSNGTVLNSYEGRQSSESSPDIYSSKRHKCSTPQISPSRKSSRNKTSRAVKECKTDIFSEEDSSSTEETQQDESDSYSDAANDQEETENISSEPIIKSRHRKPKKPGTEQEEDNEEMKKAEAVWSQLFGKEKNPENSDMNNGNGEETLEQDNWSNSDDERNSELRQKAWKSLIMNIVPKEAEKGKSRPQLSQSKKSSKPQKDRNDESIEIDSNTQRNSAPSDSSVPRKNESNENNSLASSPLNHPTKKKMVKQNQEKINFLFDEEMEVNDENNDDISDSDESTEVDAWIGEALEKLVEGEQSEYLQQQRQKLNQRAEAHRKRSVANIQVQENRKKRLLLTMLRYLCSQRALWTGATDNSKLNSTVNQQFIPFVALPENLHQTVDRRGLTPTPEALQKLAMELQTTWALNTQSAVKWCSLEGLAGPQLNRTHRERQLLTVEALWLGKPPESIIALDRSKADDLLRKAFPREMGRLDDLVNPTAEDLIETQRLIEHSGSEMKRWVDQRQVNQFIRFAREEKKPLKERKKRKRTKKKDSFKICEEEKKALNSNSVSSDVFFSLSPKTTITQKSMEKPNTNFQPISTEIEQEEQTRIAERCNVKRPALLESAKIKLPFSASERGNSQEVHKAKVCEGSSAVTVMPNPRNKGTSGEVAAATDSDKFINATAIPSAGICNLKDETETIESATEAKDRTNSSNIREDYIAGTSQVSIQDSETAVSQSSVSVSTKSTSSSHSEELPRLLTRAKPAFEKSCNPCQASMFKFLKPGTASALQDSTPQLPPLKESKIKSPRSKQRRVSAFDILEETFNNEMENVEPDLQLAPATIGLNSENGNLQSKNIITRTSPKAFKPLVEHRSQYENHSTVRTTEDIDRESHMDLLRDVVSKESQNEITETSGNCKNTKRLRKPLNTMIAEHPAKSSPSEFIADKAKLNEEIERNIKEKKYETNLNPEEERKRLEIYQKKKRKLKERRRFLESQGLIDEAASEGESEPETIVNAKKNKDKTITTKDPTKKNHAKKESDEESEDDDNEVLEDLIASKEAEDEANSIGWTSELHEFYRQKIAQDEEEIYKKHFTMEGLREARENRLKDNTSVFKDDGITRRQRLRREAAENDDMQLLDESAELEAALEELRNRYGRYDDSDVFSDEWSSSSEDEASDEEYFGEKTVEGGTGIEFGGGISNVLEKEKGRNHRLKQKRSRIINRSPLINSKKQSSSSLVPAVKCTASTVSQQHNLTSHPAFFSSSPFEQSSFMPSSVLTAVHSQPSLVHPPSPSSASINDVAAKWVAPPTVPRENSCTTDTESLQRPSYLNTFLSNNNSINYFQAPFRTQDHSNSFSYSNSQSHSISVKSTTMTEILRIGNSKPVISKNQATITFKPQSKGFVERLQELERSSSIGLTPDDSTGKRPH